MNWFFCCSWSALYAMAAAANTITISHKVHCQAHEPANVRDMTGQSSIVASICTRIDSCVCCSCLCKGRNMKTYSRFFVVCRYFVARFQAIFSLRHTRASDKRISVLSAFPGVFCDWAGLRTRRPARRFPDVWNEKYSDAISECYPTHNDRRGLSGRYANINGKNQPMTLDWTQRYLYKHSYCAPMHPNVIVSPTTRHFPPKVPTIAIENVWVINNNSVMQACCNDVCFDNLIIFELAVLQGRDVTPFETSR